MKASLFTLFGLTSLKEPNLMEHKAPELLRMQIKIAHNEIFSTTKDIDLTLLSGCVRGLSLLLKGLPDMLGTQSDEIKSVFKIIRLILDPPKHISRYECVKGSIILNPRGFEIDTV